MSSYGAAKQNNGYAHPLALFQVPPDCGQVISVYNLDNLKGG
jgi:hypothetical protein